jgi:1-acyl-sn-glycerol-3-phosphate acyltransferase
LSATPSSPAELKAHAYAREHGASRRLYACVRALSLVALRAWFRLRIIGGEHIPGEGPAIIAPNHKNFLDAFFVGVATRRRVRYMAKAELFKGPSAGCFCASGRSPCAAAKSMRMRSRPRARS